jgi:hypothetical protein
MGPARGGPATLQGGGRPARLRRKELVRQRSGRAAGDGPPPGAHSWVDRAEAAFTARSPARITTSAWVQAWITGPATTASSGGRATTFAPRAFVRMGPRSAGSARGHRPPWRGARTASSSRMRRMLPWTWPAPCLDRTFTRARAYDIRGMGGSKRVSARQKTLQQNRPIAIVAPPSRAPSIGVVSLESCQRDPP